MFVCLFILLKRVESFLHKDVNFLVTGNQEYLKETKADVKADAKGTSEEPQRSIMTRESLASDKRRGGTPRPMVPSIVFFEKVVLTMV